MPYDEFLTERIRAVLAHVSGLDSKRMFGGVGFLVRGNMACGVHGDYLIVRVGPESYRQALAQPNVREFDLTGKPMSGWVEVLPAGVESDADLCYWVLQGVEFARTLPAK